jgi:fibronectin type 3 domain-containing protein
VAVLATAGALLTAPAAPAATRTLTLAPAADATVRSDQPTTTGGSAGSLNIDASPMIHTFLKFSVTGVGSDLVESAKLRLYVSDGGSVGGLFSRVADTTWSESTMTWNTAPAADPTPFATLGVVSARAWYEVDVSSLVTGDGTFSLRVTTSSSDKVSFTSKEGKAANRPQLVLGLTSRPDLADPAATITSPADGATVSGNVPVAVDATDDLGVVSVDLKVDGTTAATDTTAPWAFTWDSRSVANGAHQLTTVARDAAGKSGTSQAVTVTVSNVIDTSPPTAPSGLSATALSSGRVDLGWTASQDDVGVTQYTVSRDGQPIGSTTGTTYQDATVGASTTYRYRVVAYDAAGNASPASDEATATTPAAPSSITFGAAGDFGAGTRASATMAKLDKSGVNLFLALGDLNYGETVDEPAWCDWVKASLPTLGPSFPFEVVAGNHEDQGAPDGYILNYASCLPDRLGSTLGPQQHYGAEYYFDYPAGNPLARMFMLSPDLTIENETYTYDLNDAHYRWLSDAIDAARAQSIPWIIVGMHKPCISSSGSGCSIGQALFDLLLKKRVDLVMMGHHHNYQRSKQLALNPASCASFVLGGYEQGCVANSGTGVMTKGAGTVVSVIGNFGRSGSTIDPLDPEAGYFASTDGSANGFTKFKLTPDRLDATYVTTSGSFTDSYSISTDGGANPDVVPPSPPSGLVATASGVDRVNVSWGASTDDVGVDHYTVSRDGAVVGTTTGSTFLDGWLTPGTTYSYVVRAVDLAGNVSDPSGTATATTAQGSQVAFPATADATIRAGWPTTNYGTSSTLAIDGSPVEHAMIKFTVTGVGSGTVANARLRLYNVGAASAGGVFGATDNTDWTETGVTWDNAPAAGATVATLGTVATNTWYEVDLSSLITGDGVYSLRVSTPSTDGIKYTSRQGAVGYTPELLVTLTSS